MRAVSLRVKINIAIFLAFLAAALAFGAILTFYMANRQAATQNRTRLLLAAVATHRLEALTSIIGRPEDLAAAKDILGRLLKVEGVTGAGLFDAGGGLVAFAGARAVESLGQPLPDGRSFTVATVDGKLAATLIEPVRKQGRILGYLRLNYSLRDLTALNQRTWFIFGLAVLGAYLLLATLLNLMLHRFVLRPVDTLRQGLQAVQDGELGHAVPVSSRDALGRMAMAFNAMSARLKETSESLARSRAEVEEDQRLLARRVEERTAELARANAQLTDEVEARTQAEDRMQRALALHQAILESTAEGVACVSCPAPGELLACNRRFLELWDLPEDWLAADEPRRRRVFLDKFADPQAALAGYEALMRDGERLDTAVIELGDGRFLERRSGPIRQGQAAIGRVFSYVDVTDEVKRQAQVERAKVRAEDASKAKGAFLAVMSHEIRTPLNVVIGLTEELLAGAASEEQRGHLRTVQQSAAHLLGVVNDVLDFSKIEAGKLVLERLDFSVRELVTGVADVFAREARLKGLCFTAAVAETVPAFLRGDPGRLRQVLLNLLGNAVKFTETGSVSLTVEAADPAASPPGRPGLVIRVADTGIGIAPDRLDGLFEDFQQGPDSIARRFGGTGLGLAITKGIIERMGGRIVAESGPGAGSIFRCTAFFLPGRAVAPESPAPEGAAASASPRRLRILLVEDNALNAAVTRLHMRRMGHDLTVATGAAQAYERLARESFDAVLMDIEMPDIDGITAARTIRAGGPPGQPALDPDLPIIAVTAHAVEDVRVRCLEAGMSGFVTKPVNYRALRRILEQAGETARMAGTAEGPDPTPSATAQHDLFDPQAAREAMGIGWDQYCGLSQISFSEGEQRLAEAGAAMAAGDLERAAIAAHTVKGAAATLGAYSCRQVAGELEKALRRRDLADSGRTLEELALLWEGLRAVFIGWVPPQEP